MSQLADLRLSQTRTEVLPGIWTSGEIIERPEPEGRSARHMMRVGDDWQPDTYGDDMSLVVEISEGLVVICGCCHAGLLNTLGHVKRVFQRPILAVLGGTHLVEADESQLRRVIDVLRDVYGSPRLHLNHCTGERAYVALASAFGDAVNPCPAGTIITFD
jgi:7,8-dihydropterin-6-yl-methyl-4-(beta-D-ribofuranosyl)aminobenzene 5'-phosphate synthase